MSIWRPLFYYITYNNLINDCYIGTNSTKQDRRTTSYKVVKYLVDNKDKYLERIPISNEMFKTVFHNKFNDDNFITLDYNIHEPHIKFFPFSIKSSLNTYLDINL